VTLLVRHGTVLHAFRHDKHLSFPKHHAAVAQLTARHEYELEGEVHADAEAELAVDAEARAATVRNHSGTHLLHAALRSVLGSQAMQKGSLVGPDRLRFDFTHDAPLEDSQIEAIEDLANRWIERNAPSSVRDPIFSWF